MVIITPLLKTLPHIIGTWSLRSTNDPQLLNTLTYLEFNYDSTIKLKTIYQDGLIGKKLSRSGKVTLIDSRNISFSSIDIKYNTYTTYSLSICGIKIPEIKSEPVKNKMLIKKLRVEYSDKTIIVNNDRINTFYIFDLCTSKPEVPFIETYLNTFLFTQFVSFFLNLILAKVLHNLFYI